MPEATFRVSAAAAQIGTSQHKLRRLCEAGQIDAERTPSGQWRIPVAEIDRLRRDGVPDLPSLPIEAHPPAPVLVPDAGIPHSPEVLDEMDAATITKTRLERRRTELELDEVEDQFRQRARQRQIVADEQRERELEAARRTARKSWEERWLKHAANVVPRGASPEALLAVQNSVREVLAALSPDSANDRVERIVVAAVSVALEPFHRRNALERILKDAVDELPLRARGTSARKNYVSMVFEAAQREVNKLGDAASLGTIREAVARAIQPVLLQARADETRESLLGGLNYWMFFKATDKERERARQTAREALYAASDECSKAALEAVMKKSLRPLEEQVEARIAAEHKREQFSILLRRAESATASYVQSNYEFDSYSERQDAIRGLQQELAEALEDAIEEGEVGPLGEGLDEWIGTWVDEQFDEDEED